MNKILRNNKYSFYKRSLIWYMSIVLLLIILCLFFLYTMYSVMSESVISAHETALEQSGNTVELVKSYVEVSATNITHNETLLQNFSQISTSETSVYPMVELIKSLQSSSYSTYEKTNFISDYYVYATDRDVVYKSNSAYTRLEEYYDDFLYIQGYDYERWYNELLRKYTFGEYLPSTYVKINQVGYKSIPYVTSVISNTGFMLGQGIFFINESIFMKSFKSILNEGASYVCLMDENNRIISSDKLEVFESTDSIENILNTNADKISIEGQDYLLIKHASENSGWTYYSIVPTSIIFTSMKPVLIIMAEMLLLLLIVGIAIAMLFAYNYSQPYKSIVNKLKSVVSDGEEYTDEILLMNKGITNLFKDMERLEESQLKQKKLLGETFMFRLMQGSFANEHSIEQSLEYLGKTIDATRFRVILLVLGNEFDEITNADLVKLDQRKAIITEVLNAYPDEVILSNSISAQEIAILYAESSDNRSSKDFCLFLHNILKLNSNIESKYYIGTEVEDLFHISESFTLAHQMVYYKLTDVEEFIVLADEQFDVNSRCEYTIEDERKLTRYAGAGEMDKINAHLNSIYAKNYSDRKISVFMNRLLFYSMTNTLVKLCNPRANNNNIEKIEQLEKIILDLPKLHNYNKFFESIKLAYSLICKISINNKDNKTNILTRRVLAYIDNNYNDINLSLESVAIVHGITSQYLSRFFKEKFGQNFTKYLERKRVDKANELLENSNISIKEAASLVGYTNSSTFRRAYTRVKGYNPSQYKYRKDS